MAPRKIKDDGEGRLVADTHQRQQRRHSGKKIGVDLELGDCDVVVALLLDPQFRQHRLGNRSGMRSVTRNSISKSPEGNRNRKREKDESAGSGDSVQGPAPARTFTSNQNPSPKDCAGNTRGWIFDRQSALESLRAWA